MEKFLHLYILNGGTAEKAVFPTSISGYEDCEPLLIDSFDYNAKRMGDAPSITATIMYPICLDNIWSTNVYVEFKGEKYFLKQIPTSSKSNTDARFKHEVTFVSERQALNDVYLFDVVGNKEETGVEDIGYVSNSTRFEFNGTIWDLAERINQSLRNSNVDYSIEIPQDKPNAIGEIETNEYKSISFQDTYVGNALQEIYNTFEIPYYFEGKTIKLGHKAKETLTEVFEYGSENALLSIAKNNTNYKVVNRITGTGSSENIPYYYPNPTPMGFVDFYVNDKKDDGLVTITNTENFNAKFRLSTKLRYIDQEYKYSPEYVVRFFGSSKFTSYLPMREPEFVEDPTTSTFYEYANEIVFPKEPRMNTNTHIYVDIDEELLNDLYANFTLTKAPHPLLPFDYTYYTPEGALRGVEQYNLDVWVCKNDQKLFKIYEEVIIGENSLKYSSGADGKPNHYGGRHIEYTTRFAEKKGNRVLVRFTRVNHAPNKETDFVFAANNISIYAVEEDVTNGWYSNDDKTNLETYGISYSGELKDGTTITIQQNEELGGSLPNCSNLMPSIYRESNGAERFYNAVNYGNKNLILNSSEKFENKNYLLARYNLEHADIKEGERVTISFNGEFGNGYATFRLFGSDSSAPIVTGITTYNLNKNTGRFEYSFTWREYGDNKQLLIYQADENRNNISSGSSVNPNRTESKIWDIKLEYGNTATKYIPAVGESNAYDSYLSPMSDEDEYYEFANTYNGYNPKEHTINFEDIKPTIKDREHNGLRIDMFEDFAYDLDDNNDKVQVNESTLDFKHPYFFGKLRPLGFNLFDRALDKGFMTINMTSGHVSGAKFEIEVGGESKVNLVRVDDEGNLLRDDKGDVVIGSEAQDKQNNTTNNYVWVALKKDAESFSQENKDWVYPDYKNNIVPKAKEDTFVITNILLPNEYIIAAEKRLDEELLAYLFQNNNEKFTFSIKFSRIYLAEHPNVYENLSENSTVNVKYNGFTYAFYVSSYAYKMRANEALPEITVELTDTLTISQSALQNALNEVKQSVISIGQANVLKTGNKYFTRKDVDDTTQGKLTFMRGAEFGEYIEGNKGASVRESDSGEWDAEFDNIKVRGKIQGALKVDGSIEVGTYAEYEDGTGNGFGVHGSDETGWNTSTDDLKVRRNARFNKGLTVGNYINGLADGTGASISGNNEDGWTIEADYLNVRRKARFNSVEIQHTQHVGGGQVLSAAGALIDLVILHEEDNGNVFYRCYFKKQDSEGNAIFNRWMIGDQARCETFNLSSTGNENGNHYYWRLVTGTSNKVEGTTTNIEPDENAWVTDGEDTIFIHEYHWVDLCDIENYSTYGKGFDVNSDIPKKGDDIFLLGHRFDTNKNRQSAIYEVAGSDDGRPYYRQYVGINSFSLDGCLEQQFMPNDNIFSGKVVIKGGSGWEELTDENGNKLGDKIKNVKGTFISKPEPTFTSYQDALMHEGYQWYNPNTKETKVWVNTQADDFEWKPVSDFSYKYLEEALRGTTAVNGGLVMTNLLMLGKYADDDTLTAENTTSGINGLVEDDNSVAVWGGGTFEKAQALEQYYRNNPKAQPTEEELKAMAKFVLTHGGKAILQDAIISGTVHATSGSFINGEFRYGTFKDVVINGSYNKLVQTINKDNLNEFFEIKTILYGGSQITAYYPLLNKWGDVIHLDMEGAENLINKIFLPYSIPSYEDGKVIFLDGIGYKVLNEDVRHLMNVDDLRSLIGRQIIIHGRNIGSQLFLECPIYRNDTIDLSGDSEILDKPQGTWVYSTPEDPKPINIANGGCVILECLLVERYYPNSAGGFTSSEMITWGYRHIRTSRDSSTKVEITITIYDTGAYTHYYYNALMDMTWDEFVSSSYNTNSDFYTDGPYVILRTKNGDRRIQTVMNDGTNDTAVQYTDTIFGNVTYYAYD